MLFSFHISCGYVSHVLPYLYLCWLVFHVLIFPYFIWLFLLSYYFQNRFYVWLDFSCFTITILVMVKFHQYYHFHIEQVSDVLPHLLFCLLSFRSTRVHPRILVGVQVIRSLVLSVSFVVRCSSFFCWPLCCLSFDLWILITHLVSSNLLTIHLQDTSYLG